MHTVHHKQKLVARVRRVNGQIQAVERALVEERGCEEVIRTIAAARGAINALGQRSCIVTIVTSKPRETSAYREALSPFDLAHLTIEVRRRVHGRLAAVRSSFEPSS